MTLHILKRLIKKYNIPESVKLQSDSEWECGPTEMDGIYYNEEKNLLIFTQYLDKDNRKYSIKNGWKSLRLDSSEEMKEYLLGNIELPYYNDGE